MNGVLIIDKPAGLTSHDVVNRVRRILQQRAVGHLGTLDPSATGVLPLVVGSLTRLAQFYTASEKTYEGVIRFGFATDTYDAEGTATSPPADVQVSLEELREMAWPSGARSSRSRRLFREEDSVVCPPTSWRGRSKEVTLKPVQVEIKESRSEFCRRSTRRRE